MDAGPGRLGLILCHVESDPPSQLRLLHGDHLVASTLQAVGEAAGHNAQLQVSVTPNALHLEIHNTVLEDEGVYTCEATNTLGQASASADFDAQGQCVFVCVHIRVYPEKKRDERGLWKPLSCIPSSLYSLK